jgi:UDP-glucose:(heptosyl)LPS alpha-1,3-glucosyltransferase
LKLAVIRQRYTPFGGAERFLERTLATLRLDELAVTVIARDWPADAQSDYRRVLVQPFSIGRAWRDAAFAHAACREVACGGYDLVQSHERLPCCDLYRAGDGVHREWLIQRARRRGGLSRLLDRVSPFHRRILAAERALFASPQLKAVVCNSRMVRDEIVRHYGVPAERLVVIPNAVDGGQFHPGLRDEFRAAKRQELSIADDRPVFLCVGSGFERKGVDLLLELWHDIDAALIVVGHDRHLAEYRQRAPAGKVWLVGAQKDVRPWLGMADVFVLPTLYDPLPNAALEALSCGLPVLTSSKSGAAEWLRPGVNGDVADALDHSAWLAMLNAWRDPARARAAASEARAAVAVLSPEAMQRAFGELYARLLANQKACGIPEGSNSCSR